MVGRSVESAEKLGALLIDGDEDAALLTVGTAVAVGNRLRLGLTRIGA